MHRVLEQDGHQVGGHDDAQQGVTELGTARQVGRPVARVHVTDSHQEARPGEGSHLLPEGGSLRDRDAAMDFRQGRQFGRSSPCGGRFFSWRQVRAFHQRRKFLPVERIQREFSEGIHSVQSANINIG